jgi:AAA family ATP:ADP antiporter
VKYAVLIMPLIALGGYAILAFYPVLTVVRWAKTAENATDYSLQNTLRHMLFLPTSRDQKYKAKQAIDSFFVRAGDVLSAVLVFGGTTYLALRPPGFALVNLMLVLVWLVLAMGVGREFHRRTAE